MGWWTFNKAIQNELHNETHNVKVDEMKWPKKNNNEKNEKTKTE